MICKQGTATTTTTTNKLIILLQIQSVTVQDGLTKSLVS